MCNSKYNCQYNNYSLLVCLLLLSLYREGENNPYPSLDHGSSGSLCYIFSMGAQADWPHCDCARARRVLRRPLEKLAKAVALKAFFAATVLVPPEFDASTASDYNTRNDLIDSC